MMFVSVDMWNKWVDKENKEWVWKTEYKRFQITIPKNKKRVRRSERSINRIRKPLVLCKGWIDSWKDFEGSEIRQVCVKQPTIKVADKNLVFAEQKVISTEHHINLFIPFEDLTEYKAQFQQHRTISFSGVVKQYTRRNGTTDYGIAAALNTTYTLISSAYCLLCALWGSLTAHNPLPSTSFNTQRHLNC